LEVAAIVLEAVGARLGVIKERLNGRGLIGEPVAKKGVDLEVWGVGGDAPLDVGE
jgi:hypothetical protein